MTDVTILRDASIVGWEVNGWLLITDDWLESRDVSTSDQEAIIVAVEKEFAQKLREHK